MDNTKVTYKLENITEVMENEIKEGVQKNLNGKMTSAFKKIRTNHFDSDIRLDIHIKKNEQTKYEGAFHLHYAGITKTYHNDKPFKILEDLVNHAFQNIKTQILEK